MSFAADLLPEIPDAPWTIALNRDEMRSIWPRIDAVQAEPSYDNDLWLFGGDDVPRWTGYTIGYDAVRRYLAAHSDESAATAVDVSASEILAGYSP